MAEVSGGSESNQPGAPRKVGVYDQPEKQATGSPLAKLLPLLIALAVLGFLAYQFLGNRTTPTTANESAPIANTTPDTTAGTNSTGMGNTGSGNVGSGSTGSGNMGSGNMGTSGGATTPGTTANPPGPGAR